MMPAMAVKREDPNQSRFIRLIRWLINRRGGRVQAMQDALRLRKSLRFITLGSVMILLPSLLLAYFGISSIQGEELAVIEDVKNQADGAASTFTSQFERPLNSFEDAVFHRIEAGRSPLEAPKELHPDVLVALKLDASLTVVAPFFRGATDQQEPIDFLFNSASRRALDADRRGEPESVVSRLYLLAERDTLSIQNEARMRFDRARLLGRSGRPAEASAIMDAVLSQFANLRDPWGFRMEDLVGLFRAESLMEISPLEGAEALRELVARVMGRRWSIGRGGEGAVARRSLSLLEPFADAEWVAATRERIDDRMGLLYWTEELLPELDSLLAGGRNLRIDKGKLRWVEGERGLWALTWWDEDLYAFALDRTQLIHDARALAKEVSQPSSPVRGMLVQSDVAFPPGALSRRALVPWILGWSMVVVPQDAAALADDLATRRNRRVGIIVLAIVLIGVGALSTARFVRTELDAARVKTDFAANVSHELRSPITQIRLKAESLMLGLSDTPEEQARDYRIIVRESERLSRLVDNVLDFSAIERGAKTYALVPGDLGETVSAAIEVVEGSAELVERDLFVQIRPDLPVVAHDADAIAQCVINLLSNAAKYSGPDKPIKLVLEREGQGVRILVIDRGIGIPDSDVRQIFEPFFRGADASVRRRKGTGIGLAITFYIVSAHNGVVDVVSRPGEGSTFSLWFPAAGAGPMTRKGA
jgi:signal transduction histidine kinase